MSRSLVSLRTVLVGTGSILVLLLLLLGLGRSRVTRFIPSSTGNDGSLQNIRNATLGVGITSPLSSSQYKLIAALDSSNTSLPSIYHHGRTTGTNSPWLLTSPVSGWNTSMALRKWTREVCHLAVRRSKVKG